MIRCIDVSAHNGVIDFQKVTSSGMGAVIIRAGYGDSITQQDKRFKENIEKAIAAGLQIGIYWFSYADSPEDALKEWLVCKLVIEPYCGKITLPVVFDYEYDSVAYYKKIHGAAPSNALINQMANAFLSAAKADGWKTALYTNNDYRLHVFSTETLAMWDIWLADYTGSPSVPCVIQQTSSTGSVPGISGNVDMDAIFKDYAPAAVQCDTTSDMTMKHGAFYQLKVTVTDGRPPQVTAPTPGVVAVLPRYVMGSDHYIYICAIGAPGSGTGIFVNGDKKFAVNIK